MSYPFVQAMYHGPAGSFRELRAVTVHMAEGGGTVSWLTHPSNANSSHFVIEYSGRIVQMVRDDEYDYSLHIARPYGPPGPGDYGIYSLDVAKAVLGDGIGDPNRYMYAVELEGFAAAGPNAAQVASLAALIADLRGRYPSLRGNLAHRDFQSYKDCPGGHIPWASLGGHGLYGGAPAPAPQYSLSRVERLPDGTRFDCRGTVNVWDPLRPGSPVGKISGSTAIRWRAEIDWPSANIPQGYPFDQISEPGGYFNCWVFEGDGEVLLPVPQTTPVPPVVEQPPVAEQPPIVLPPAPEPTPEPTPPIPTPIPTVPRTARKPERGPRQGRYGRIKDI